MRTLRDIAPGVAVATSATWSTTTTVVTGSGGGCLVVDPALTVPELTGLAAHLRDRGDHVTVAWSTHPHWDHVLWHRALGQAPRWATAEAAEVCARTRPALVAEADEVAPGHDPDQVGAVRGLDPGRQELPWDGPEAVVVPFPGHCRGHAGLLLPGPGVLVVGDMLSDVEVPLLDLDAEDPVRDYRQGLEVLEGAMRGADVRVVVPGHGTVARAGEARGRLAADRAYLDDLERAARQAGTEVRDRRLADPWVAGEHRRQAAHLTAVLRDR